MRIFLEYATKTTNFYETRQKTEVPMEDFDVKTKWKI